MKTIMIILVALISINVAAQRITFHLDEMTDKYYYFYEHDDNEPKALLISNNGIHGLVLRIFFKETGKTSFNPHPTPQTIFITMALEGLGCVEYGFVIFLFKDGSKLQLSNWNDFDCEGAFYFTPSKEDWNELYSKEINKIMVEDGRSHSSYTDIFPDSQYFIKFNKALKVPAIQNQLEE